MIHWHEKKQPIKQTQREHRCWNEQNFINTVEDLKGKWDIMSEQMGALTRETYTVKKNPVKILEMNSVKYVRIHHEITYRTLRKKKDE